MSISLVRLVAAGMVAVSLAGCAKALDRPATVPTTDVNPITGSRGGSGSAN